MGGFVLSGCRSVEISRIWPGRLRALPPPEAGLDRGQDVRSVNTLSQMQPLTGALPCGKGHLQSIPLERKLCFGLCHCGWLKVRRSPLLLRLSSVTGILGWIIRLSLLLLKNTRS